MMGLYAKATDILARLLRFAFCSRKRGQVCRSKAEKRPNFPEYRAWIQNAFGVDAWDWDTLETAPHGLRTTGLRVHLNACFGIAVTFVVNNEVIDLLEKLYRRQQETALSYHEGAVFHLMFLLDNTMVSLYPAK